MKPKAHPCDARLEMMILGTLAAHEGADRAISAPALANVLGVSERAARKWVRHLRVKHGALILATPADGYFAPTCWEDAQHTIASLISREAHTRETRLSLERSLTKRFGQQQTEMFGSNRRVA